MNPNRNFHSRPALEMKQLLLSIPCTAYASIISIRLGLVLLAHSQPKTWAPLTKLI